MSNHDRLNAVPTEEQLAAVLRYPNAPTPIGYEGGFTTVDAFGDPAVEFRIGGDDSAVHLHCNVSAGVGGGSSSVYARLSVEESRELRLALEMAEKAAE